MACSARAGHRRQVLLLATEDAVVVLEMLMDEARSEAVRLSAAVEILDRAGIRGGVEIRPLPPQESPSEVLQERLATLSRRMSEARDRGCRSFDP
jgi:hypothetical protein